MKEGIQISIHILIPFPYLHKKPKPMETDQLKTIIPNVNWEKAQAFIPHIPNILPNFGINTSLRKAHFLAQLAHESGGLRYTEENLNYSAKALSAGT